MKYSITEVARKMNLAPSTIRYYEQERLLPNIQRTNNGIRYFTDSNLERLTLICCLKKTGMSIREIQNCFFLCDQGDSMIDERLGIFTSHKQHIINEIDELQKCLKRVDDKINILNKKKQQNDY